MWRFVLSDFAGKCRQPWASLTGACGAPMEPWTRPGYNVINLRKRDTSPAPTDASYGRTRHLATSFLYFVVERDTYTTSRRRPRLRRRSFASGVEQPASGPTRTENV